MKWITIIIIIIIIILIRNDKDYIIKERKNIESRMLPLEFYLREDPLQVGRDLLGKYLFTNHEGIVTGGEIIEVSVPRPVHHI